MKLFIIAALVAAVSAARLEHLERGYLPPSQNNYAANSGGSSFPSAGAHGSFGFGNQGSHSANGHGSNGFGSFSRANDYVAGSGSNGFGANGHGSNGIGTFSRANDFIDNGAGSNGFGASGQGSNGFGANGRGSNGFGSSYGSNGAFGRNSGSSAATSNQYLPPNYGASGSNGGSTFGSSIRPACSSCGSSFGSPQRYQSTFGQSNSIPSTQYGRPQSFGPSSSFESQPSFTAQQDEPSGASRQYLAPKTGSQSPQQPFDENTGYIY